MHCETGMKACGGSHHWARQLQALGYRVTRTFNVLPCVAARPFRMELSVILGSSFSSGSGKHGVGRRATRKMKWCDAARRFHVLEFTGVVICLPRNQTNSHFTMCRGARHYIHFEWRGFYDGLCLRRASGTDGNASYSRRCGSG